jgi:hypothetical protein
MTRPSTPLPASFPAPRSREPWVTPTLQRIDSADAENSVNPNTADGLTFGS